MRLSQLTQYVCPKCHSGHLIIETSTDVESDNIDSGNIKCTCGTTVPIIHSLPRFVPTSNYAESFGFQWNVHSKTQLDSYSGKSISHDRVFGVTGWARDLRGQRILETGSGAERFTEILVKTGAEIVSFDYSNAVDANSRNSGSNTNLALFLGGIFNIPLKPGSFDKVLCLGVLQHTPDPAAAFASLARFVRPGGRLIIDVYRKDLAALLQWKHLLRPITKRVNKKKLYKFIQKLTPILIPFASIFRKIAGRAAARFMPIVEYSHLGLSTELNEQWAILDTFDMYYPAHDHPQTLTSVERWFEQAGFTETSVRRGPNGIIGMGTRPE